ncbi:site-specific DNA-methyltransferase [Gemella sp. GH3]|uniref:site-specific DNA-methyltransferase n=1 Tax=unclassified Gemella TaxID=2624949 RepID=UPI0015D017F5|nr:MULTISPECIES: site-specific DNA-methyltransferase [unclassified Gemella]MBF0714157.1 site-specific DNA-methyltransferase [Gemella sp. GH3.1]NYS51109.1 site-specific DNA-methyltransferase [Gemella sp. GH3]
MANISQQKRQKMLEFLEKLKQEHQDDDSLRALGEIETALNEKKYGLVWERHIEKVDEMLEHNIPVFCEDRQRKIVADEDDGYNFLLEGDNLHSLKLLEKTHKGKIDVIYIDPPYNTKNKEFIYEDKIIGLDDYYRHSKWLSFIHERLKIAKNLLNEKGFILISIDENEFAQLKLLCDDIFGDMNYLTTFIRKTKSMTGDDGNGLNIQHEYLHVYGKNKLSSFFIGEEKSLEGYSNPDNDPNGIWTSGDPSAKSGSDSTYFPIENPITGQIDYPPTGRYWAFSLQTMNQYIKMGRIKFKDTIKKNQRGFIFKRYASNLKTQFMPVDTLYFIENEFMNSVATKELSVLVKNEKFDYPKPTYFVEKLIKFTSNKNSTILDFFAGSGTTGHAVMQLNKEDGGNRKYILCTNNENNICEEVTYQRLKNIQDELPHNLKYFKTDFISKYESDEDEETISEKMLEHIKELIELEHHIEIDNEKYIILDDEDELKSIVENIKEGGKLFITSGIFLSRTHQRILDDKNVTVVDIPEYYYRSELKEVGEL